MIQHCVAGYSFTASESEMDSGRIGDGVCSASVDSLRGRTGIFQFQIPFGLVNNITLSFKKRYFLLGCGNRNLSAEGVRDGIISTYSCLNTVLCKQNRTMDNVQFNHLRPLY